MGNKHFNRLLEVLGKRQSFVIINFLWFILTKNLSQTISSLKKIGTEDSFKGDLYPQTALV